MDGYYGPFNVSDKSHEHWRTFRRYAGRPRAIAVSKDGLKGDVYNVKKKCALAELTDPNNFTQALMDARKAAQPKVWSMQDFQETGIPRLPTIRPDLKNRFPAQERNLTWWLTDDIIDAELDVQRTKHAGQDAFIATCHETDKLSDERIEISETYILASKKFGVYVLNNGQSTPSPIPEAGDERTITFQTKEIVLADIKVTRLEIENDIAPTIKKLAAVLGVDEKAGNIWWERPGDMVNQGGGSHILFDAGFTGFDLTRRIPDDAAININIFYGAVKTVLPPPIAMRRTGKVSIDTTRRSAGSHWTLVIIDFENHQAYLHDSSDATSLQKRAVALIANLNWLLEHNLGGGAYAYEEIVLVNAGAQNQRNGYDCGIFALGNVEAFLEGLEKDNNTACHKSGLIQKDWDSVERRKKLYADFPERSYSIKTENALRTLDTKFQAHRKHIFNHTFTALDEAFWHLDNAGAILLTFVDLSKRKCTCTLDPATAKHSNDCGFVVLPVPVGHRVIIQSPTRKNAKGAFKVDPNKPPKHSAEATKVLDELKGQTLSPELMEKYSLVLASNTPSIMVSHDDQGPYVQSNAFMFQRTMKEVSFEGCGVSMTTPRHDCLGPIPLVSSLRVNDRLWVWISIRQEKDYAVEPAVQSVHHDRKPSTRQTWKDTTFRTRVHSGYRGPGEDDYYPTGQLHQVEQEELDDDMGVMEDAQETWTALAGRVREWDGNTQSVAKKLKETRETLRKAAPVTPGMPIVNHADSSDDSIDRGLNTARPILYGIGGRNPEQLRNHRVINAKKERKRIYVYSDSERDSDGGHDPTGASRVKKRVKLSGDPNNWNTYIGRGQERQLRTAVRPTAAFLRHKLTKNELSRYDTGRRTKSRKVKRTRGIATDIITVTIIQDGKPLGKLPNRVFEEGYRGIAEYLRQHHKADKGATLWYTPGTSTKKQLFDSQTAFTNFKSAVLDLHALKGTIIITTILTPDDTAEKKKQETEAEEKKAEAARKKKAEEAKTKPKAATTPPPKAATTPPPKAAPPIITAAHRAHTVQIYTDVLGEADIVIAPEIWTIGQDHVFEHLATTLGIGSNWERDRFSFAIQQAGLVVPCAATDFTAFLLTAAVPTVCILSILRKDVTIRVVDTPSLTIGANLHVGTIPQHQDIAIRAGVDPLADADTLLDCTRGRSPAGSIASYLIINGKEEVVANDVLDAAGFNALRRYRYGPNEYILVSWLYYWLKSYDPALPPVVGGVHLLVTKIEFSRKTTHRTLASGFTIAPDGSFRGHAQKFDPLLFAAMIESFPGHNGQYWYHIGETGGTFLTKEGVQSVQKLMMTPTTDLEKVYKELRFRMFEQEGGEPPRLVLFVQGVPKAT